MTNELEEIKNIRKKLGITQFQLAKQANVSQSLIAKIESGRLDPSFSNAQKIFQTLEDLSKKKELTAKEIMNKRILHVAPVDNIKKAIQKMRKHQISQMPVIENHKAIGFISESILLECLTEKNAENIKEIMAQAPPIISKDTTTNVISNLLKYYPMVLVSDKGKLIGLITKADLLGKLYK